MAFCTLDNLEIKKNFYKVIALDLDGTLLMTDKSISKRTIDTLQKAQQQGFSVAIATGRHPKSAMRYMEQLGCLNEKAYAVCFNGAAVISLDNFKKEHKEIGFSEIFAKTGSGADIKQVVAFAHEHGCNVHAYSKNRGLLIETHNPHSDREINHGQVGFTIVDFMQCADDEQFYKILTVGDEEKIDVVRELIPDSLKAKFSVVRSDENFLEFIPAHSTKGTALVHLCECVGTTIEHAIACGDAENDIAMIDTAGLGVVMGQADDKTKSYADVVTLDNDHDGVAALVEKFLD